MSRSPPSQNKAAVSQRTILSWSEEGWIKFGAALSTNFSSGRCACLPANLGKGDKNLPLAHSRGSPGPCRFSERAG